MVLASLLYQTINDTISTLNTNMTSTIQECVLSGIEYIKYPLPTYRVYKMQNDFQILIQRQLTLVVSLFRPFQIPCRPFLGLYQAFLKPIRNSLGCNLWVGSGRVIVPPLKVKSYFNTVSENCK